MRWLINLLQDRLDNATRREAERDFAEILEKLRIAPDYEIGPLLCCLTCLRLGFESNGDIPEGLFERDYNSVKNRSKVIQANFSAIVAMNYRENGDRMSRLAGLILLCSMRAVAYPEFIPRAAEIWNLLERGKSKYGMEAFIECLRYRGSPYTELQPLIIAESSYFPPILVEESSKLIDPKLLNIIYFKSNPAALEYASTFLICPPLRRGNRILAMIVSIQSDYTVKIASNPPIELANGKELFMKFAAKSQMNFRTLEIFDLVIIQIQDYECKNGLPIPFYIIDRVKPEYSIKLETFVSEIPNNV